MQLGGIFWVYAQLWTFAFRNQHPSCHCYLAAKKALAKPEIESSHVNHSPAGCDLLKPCPVRSWLVIEILGGAALRKRMIPPGVGLPNGEQGKNWLQENSACVRMCVCVCAWVLTVGRSFSAGYMDLLIMPYICIIGHVLSISWFVLCSLSSIFNYPTLHLRNTWVNVVRIISTINLISIMMTIFENDKNESPHYFRQLECRAVNDLTVGACCLCVRLINYTHLTYWRPWQEKMAHRINLKFMPDHLHIRLGERCKLLLTGGRIELKELPQ